MEKLAELLMHEKLVIREVSLSREFFTWNSTIQVRNRLH